jgi:hypothetical protein
VIAGSRLILTAKALGQSNRIAMRGIFRLVNKIQIFDHFEQIQIQKKAPGVICFLDEILIKYFVVSAAI